MSLVGADGSSYTFSTPSEPASSMQMSDAAPAATISTRNSFQFDLPSASTPSLQMGFSPAAAAPAGGMFTSQPINLGSPLVFAPSHAQRPAGVSGSTKLDFSEFESEIASMEEAKKQEFLEHLALNAQKIRDEKVGTAALPSQIGDSKLFHEQVLKQYGKIHHLELDAKKVFQSRKVKQRDARRAKKAEDKADQMENKSGGAMRKAKGKNRSKGAY